MAEMPLDWSSRTYAWRARWARARARTGCACAQRGRRENGSRGQEEGGDGGGAGWSSPLRTGGCAPWRASAWRVRVVQTTGRTSGSCLGRGWQGAWRAHDSQTGCNGGGDSPGVGSHGGWIPGGRPWEDRGLLVPGVSAGARRGERPRGHEQGRVRGLACGRRRRWPGARRGVVGGRGRCVAGGAGQRVDLRPGGGRQGRELMEIGWGGRRRRGRSRHGRRRLACRRRRLVAGLGGREGENPSWIPCWTTDFPFLGQP